ncbi:MAG TPA: hypothetical protein VHP36_05230 [Chitinispirillaceae bacterium]|nr:hypothetical protein [Chitinispirillaceae bacterium]
MRISLLLIPFMLCCSLNAAYTELAGDLPKLVTADKSPYLVISDIFIPAGKIVRIEPGTVFLFKNFTGVHVQGILIVNGTESKPVLFTSENDRMANPSSTLNPTPFDWNGIYIHKDGLGSDLQHIKVQYSVKGIISETRFIRIFKGFFFENGRNNLNIEGVDKEVVESEPYSYSLSLKDAVVDGIPAKILQDPQARKRNIFRYSGLGLCVIGAVSGTFAATELKSSIKRFDVINKDLGRVDGDKAWSKAHSEVNRNTAWTASSFLVSAIGVFLFTWSFTF